MPAPVEILYNSVCPVCEAGACDLRRRAPPPGMGGAILTDVSNAPEALARAGVTLDQVRLKMHAITPEGRVVRGMPAIALAWRVTPGYRTLGRLMQVAPFSWIGAMVYHVAAHLLWTWNRACGRW